MMYPVDHFCEDKPPEVLFHYTSQEGLLGILQSRCVWASGIQHLNDSTEYDHGHDLFVQVARDRMKENKPDEVSFLERVGQIREFRQDHRFFVTSFTENGDDLGLWRGYTPRGTGFSIGVNSERLTEGMAGPPDTKFQLVRCRYEESEKREFILKFLQLCLEQWKTHDIGSLENSTFDAQARVRLRSWELYRLGAFYLAPVLKHGAFANEREWRLIGECPVAQDMKFRAGNSWIVPYLEVPLEPLRGGLSPLRSVVVGPCPEPQTALSSVRLLLQSKELNQVEVRSSAIPYRTW